MTDSLHTAVSNETAEEANKTVMQSDANAGGDGTLAAAGDHEAVEGYTPSAVIAAVPTDVVTGASSEFAAVEVDLASLKDLRDIGEASFGPPPPAPPPPPPSDPMFESILGADERVRIQATNQYPWRAIASLLITAADNSQWIGTGWFISPRTLITAGHCVFIKGSGVPGRDGWVKRITVIPGRNAAASPFGQVISTVFRSVTGWTQNGDQEYDYGAIILPTPKGNVTGWFGFGNYPDNQLVNGIVNISGYPGDKPSGEHWYGSNRVTNVSARKVHYLVDTAGGQSGAPVWRNLSNGRFAVAIHAYGSGGGPTNSGTRINGPVFQNLQNWKV